MCVTISPRMFVTPGKVTSEMASARKWRPLPGGVFPTVLLFVIQQSKFAVENVDRNGIGGDQRQHDAKQRHDDKNTRALLSAVRMGWNAICFHRPGTASKVNNGWTCADRFLMGNSISQRHAVTCCRRSVSMCEDFTFGNT